MKKHYYDQVLSFSFEVLAISRAKSDNKLIWLLETNVQLL